jgi:hypothetical protein
MAPRDNRPCRGEIRKKSQKNKRFVVRCGSCPCLHRVLRKIESEATTDSALQPFVTNYFARLPCDVAAQQLTAPEAPWHGRQLFHRRLPKKPTHFAADVVLQDAIKRVATRMPEDHPWRILLDMPKIQTRSEAFVIQIVHSMLSRMEAARTSLRTKKAPSVVGGGPSDCAVYYRIRPGDDPPRLVVAVVMNTEQMLRIKLLWIVSPASSTLHITTITTLSESHLQNSDGVRILPLKMEQGEACRI